MMWFRRCISGYLMLFGTNSVLRPFSNMLLAGFRMSLIPDRIIRTSGEGLLPTCYEPQIPSDIRENERVRVIPPSPPWRPVSADDLIRVFEDKAPQDQRYWFIRSADEEKLPAFEWDFQSDCRSKVFGSGNGLNSLPNDTNIRFKSQAAKANIPDLWAPFGDQVLLASKYLLDLMIQFHETALEHRRVILRASDNSLIGEIYVIDVVLNIPAVDIANSIVDYRGQTRNRPPALKGYVSCRIRDDISESVHLFRQISFSGSGGYLMITSDEFRRAVINAVPPLENIRFYACG